MLKVTLITISILGLGAIAQSPACASSYDMGYNGTQPFSTAVQVQVTPTQTLPLTQPVLLNAKTGQPMVAIQTANGISYVPTAPNTTNLTGSGTQGVGGLQTSATGAQTPVLQYAGTMGLAPVFGYGAPSVSPGGYVPGMDSTVPEDLSALPYEPTMPIALGGVGLGVGIAADGISAGLSIGAGGIGAAGIGGSLGIATGNTALGLTTDGSGNFGGSLGFSSGNTSVGLSADSNGDLGLGIDTGF